MTVGELIEALSKFSPDTKVIVDGYEGGAAECKLYETKIVLDHYDEWYYGNHEFLENFGKTEQSAYPSIDAVHLARIRT